MAAFYTRVVTERSGLLLHRRSRSSQTESQDSPSLQRRRKPRSATPCSWESEPPGLATSGYRVVSGEADGGTEEVETSFAPKLRRLAAEQLKADGATEESQANAIAKMQGYLEREDKKYGACRPRVSP